MVPWDLGAMLGFVWRGDVVTYNLPLFLLTLTYSYLHLPTLHVCYIYNSYVYHHLRTFYLHLCYIYLHLPIFTYIFTL